MGDKTSPYGKATAFFKAILSPKHKTRTFARIKEEIFAKMIAKYSFTADAYYKMRISQILNKKAYPNAVYQEYLLMIDDQEFLTKFYSARDYNTTFAFVVTILSYLVKDFPNYLALGKVYLIMLSNLLQKQKLINDSYERLVDAYKSQNKDSYNNLFDSQFSQEGKNSLFDDDKYVQRLFFKKPKDDSIDSVEMLIGVIEKNGEANAAQANALMSTPLKKKMASQNRRRSSLISILKKMTYGEVERDSRSIKDTLEDEAFRRVFPYQGVRLLFPQKIDSAKKQAAKKKSSFSVSAIKNSKSLISDRKSRKKFVKTSVFIDKFRSNALTITDTTSIEKMEKQAIVKTKHNETYSSTTPKFGLFFSGNNLFKNLKKVKFEDVSLPSIKIKHIHSKSHSNRQEHRPINVKASLYQTLNPKSFNAYPPNHRLGALFTKGLLTKQFHSKLNSSRTNSLRDSCDMAYLNRKNR